MKMILKRKKAVSPVIATILLIALTVTAAAIVYFVVVPLLRNKPEFTVLDYGVAVGNHKQYEMRIQNLGEEGEISSLTDIVFELANGTQYNPVKVFVGAVEVTSDTPLVTIGQASEVSIVFEFLYELDGTYDITISYSGENGGARTLTLSDII